MDKQSPSELRLDPVSRGWVVIATGRARRPESFQKEKGKRLPSKKTDCPFEDLSSQEPATLVLRNGKEMRGIEKWTTAVIPNKFPAFSPEGEQNPRSVGPYQLMDGVGFHEVIITKDHKKDVPQFTLFRVVELLLAYQKRYVELAKHPFVRYISIFKNKGAEAGASLAHPHSQLIAVAVTDPDVQRSLDGSKEYFDRTGKCVHCDILQWEAQEKTRVVYENERAIAVCPFASRVAFEMRIFPKRHNPRFEQTEEKELRDIADALQKALSLLYTALGDPDYNYFIHTAPVRRESYEHYHWHIEILPKTSTWAGFELGTGIEISTIEPEKAAAYLRATA